MMALISFLAVVLIGAALIVAGVAAASITLAFSGRVEWPPVVFLCGIGSALIYLAATHSPIAISWSAA